MLLFSVLTMEDRMVQKIDKENKDSKKVISNPTSASDKTQSQQLGKQSSHKTGKSVTRKNDPSGLPKYR
jgi:hypothetical protein